MTADQKQKLIKLQAHIREIIGFEVEDNYRLGLAAKLIHELLTESNPFTEQRKPEVEVHPV
jgi:hypothetical protein